MSWNYRVVKTELGSFEFREVYYEGKKIKAISTKAVVVIADSMKGLEWQMTEMHAALDKPIIDYAQQKRIFKRKVKP